MIEDTIRQIEERLHSSENIAPATRTELLAMLANLRAEAKSLPAGTATKPTSRSGETPNAESMEDSVEQLRRSVEEFEGSHPQVVQLVNHLANTLAGLGI